MATVSERLAKMPRLNATDPNLAFLASKAAIELDRILQGRPIGSKAIGELASLLRSSSEQVIERDEPSTLWDPATVSLVHSAISSAGFSKVATLDELMSRAISIADELESSGEATDDDAEIRQLRSFCIGLANSAVAQERFQFESAFEKAHWS